MNNNKFYTFRAKLMWGTRALLPSLLQMLFFLTRLALYSTCTKLFCSKMNLTAVSSVFFSLEKIQTY